MTGGSGPHRLPQGGQIDRGREIVFTFDGRRYTGFAGDTLASALLANGVRTVGRSFKFHRPRGIFSCGSEETSALVQLHGGPQTIPSARAPLIELTPDLSARAQSGWPSVRFDLGRVLDFAAPLWAAGFYNKTFMWPSWHTYEPLIRRMAGLGRAPPERDTDRYDVGNLHCDVLVIGGGTAGLEAALKAAAGGERVVLVEQDRAWGGMQAWAADTIDGLSPRLWIERALEQLRGLPDVRLMLRTTAVGHYDANIVALLERVQGAKKDAARERYWIARPQRIVLATGTIEQPLIFANNDRPGTMLAGAARQYLCRYGVALGAKVVVATNNDSVYALAEDLHRAGVAIAAIADSRREIPVSLDRAMRAKGIAVLQGWIPVETSGFGSLHSVTLGRLSTDALRIEERRVLRCDALAVSGGFNPALQLFAQAGGKLRYDGASGSLVPSSVPPVAMEIAGSAAGTMPIGPRVSPVGRTQRKWIDLLHDVTVSDLELAVREGFIAVEHIKRYTTVGMAADQGKTSAAPSLEVIGQVRGIDPATLGHTTMRPPVVPVTLGAIAGREIGARFLPARELPMHGWHLAHGGLMQDFGEWQRAVVYQREGLSRHEAARREALAVRTAAGLFDGSSLGKIELLGPDALEFLDRFYINDLKTLKPFRARYGLMLRESGILFDDGTVVMLAPDHLVITTTSGNAGRVYQWLEEWRQCEWPDMRVAIIPVTEQWATLSLAGPKSRAILEKLSTDIDLAPESFPHLAMRAGALLGVPARIYRVSFTGELTYEINVPASAGPGLWEALMLVGASQGVVPFGMDALMLMRMEKGFLHIGSDTDGTTVPDDVGWGKVAANKQRHYIGKRSLSLPEHLRNDRLQLVGLAGVKGRSFIIGSHLRLPDSGQATDGWITSAGDAVLTEEPLALALVRGGRARVGTTVDIYDSGAVHTRATIVSPPFHDPKGERMNG